MQCRRCGTEIADKAIVCYRCGTATADPVRRPVPVRTSRSLLPSLFGAAILALCAVAAVYLAPAGADAERWRAAAAILAGAAAVVLVLGVVRRRRTRKPLK